MPSHEAVRRMSLQLLNPTICLLNFFSGGIEWKTQGSTHFIRNSSGNPSMSYFVMFLHITLRQLSSSRGTLVFGWWGLYKYETKRKIISVIPIFIIKGYVTSRINSLLLWMMDRYRKIYKRLTNANKNGHTQSVELYATSATISVIEFRPETHIALLMNVATQLFHYLSKWQSHPRGRSLFWLSNFEVDFQSKHVYRGGTIWGAKCFSYSSYVAYICVAFKIFTPLVAILVFNYSYFSIIIWLGLV